MGIYKDKIMCFLYVLAFNDDDVMQKNKSKCKRKFANLMKNGGFLDFNTIACGAFCVLLWC